MDFETSSSSATSHEVDRLLENEARSGGTKRKRVPSTAALARARIPAPAMPSAKDARRKQKKEKDAAQDSEKENSLGTLTKRFMEVAAQYPDGLLELNEVAAQLGVSKRRMYDITNVLEGINLVEKQSKNVVLWKAGTPLTEDQKSKISSMRKEVDRAHQMEKKLDSSIFSVQHAIDRYVGMSTCFVHHSDVRDVPYLSGQMILAVKAAKGAEVAVDPAPGLHRMTLRSGSEIDVYVLTSEDTVAPPTTPGHHDSLGVPAAISPSADHLLSTPRRMPRASSAHASSSSTTSPNTKMDLEHPGLGSLVQIADAASNQAPVPLISGSNMLTVGSDSTKSSPTASLLNPPSPISPVRSSHLGLGLEDGVFSFGSPGLFTSTSPLSHLTGNGNHKPQSLITGSMGEDSVLGLSPGLPHKPIAHLFSPLSSTSTAFNLSSPFPLATSSSKERLHDVNGVEAVGNGGDAKVKPEGMEVDVTDHDDMGRTEDESAEPGMLNPNALRSGALGQAHRNDFLHDGSSPFKPMRRTSNARTNPYGLAAPAAASASPTSSAANLVSTSSMSNLGVPTSNWAGIATPEVSSAGFEIYYETTSSPTKTLSLSPTSSPEKRPYPLGGFGSHDLDTTQDGLTFFPESSIGIPSHSRR